MADLFQDITVTLNLSDMSLIKYKRTIKHLKEISEDKIETDTYTREYLELGGVPHSSNTLSDEHKKLLKKFTT